MFVENLVSVLVPCYNHEKYIIRCLDSIKNNTYKLKEVIFIDDGSTDNSFEKAKSYLDEYRIYFYDVKYLKQNNQGVTKTLNKLLSLSSGGYITVLASDDYLTTDSLELRIDYLKTHNKEAVIGKSYIVDENDSIISNDAAKKLYRANYKMLLSKHIKKELTIRWSAVGPTLLLKRVVYDEIGVYNENLKVEDRDFYLRLLLSNKLGYIDKNISYYRVHSSNVSRTKTMKQRAKLLEEISDVNIKASLKAFTLDEKIFLKSYEIDKKLIKNNLFGVLFLYKGFRVVISQIYLFIFNVIYNRG